MKRLVSILLILSLGFTGGSSILHQLEQDENHTHEAGTHLCEEDAHHHCSLCDTLMTFGLVTAKQENNEYIAWNSTYRVAQTSLYYSNYPSNTQGRAPPMK